mgnify:FL=1
MPKHYLIELTTEIAVVLDDKENQENLYQDIINKTQLIMDNTDFNDKTFSVKVIAQEGVTGATTEKENAV